MCGCPVLPSGCAHEVTGLKKMLMWMSLNFCKFYQYFAVADATVIVQIYSAIMDTYFVDPSLFV